MPPARFFIQVTRAVALLKRAKVFIVSVTYMCVYLDTYTYSVINRGYFFCSVVTVSFATY